MTVSTLDYDALITDEDIALAIGEVKLESETLQLRIHKIVVAIACQWAVSGDVRPAVKHMNTLVEELGAGVRKNALIQYATSPKLFGMIVKDGTIKELVPGKMKHTDLDMKAIANTHWFDFKEPPAPKAWDIVVEYKKFLAKATTRSAKGLAIDTLNPEFLAEMAKLTANLEAADIGPPQ